METVGNSQKPGIRRGCGYEDKTVRGLRLLLPERVELLLGEPVEEARA